MDEISGEKGKGRRKATVAEKLLVKRFRKVHGMG